MLLKPVNPKAVDPQDKYLLIRQLDLHTWRVIEGQPTKEKAEKALKIMKEHNPNGVFDIRERLAWT